jgi:hypothetical protein
LHLRLLMYKVMLQIIKMGWFMKVSAGNLFFNFTPIGFYPLPLKYTDNNLVDDFILMIVETAQLKE